jgi:cell shape-determining protein MreC
MINREEYSSTLTKLKRIQRENEKLRETLEITKREADYWERAAKRIDTELHSCEANLRNTTIALKLWKGVAE